MVTDYDCWREGEEAVSVADVLLVLRANADRASDLVRKMAGRLSTMARTPDPDGIDTCLDHAVITHKETRDPGLAARLDAVAGRVLKS
jgi:5'-methylthioadenosine phosphorylase